MLDNIKDTKQISEVSEWWIDLAHQGDAEGDLVLGLLLRTHLLEQDPDGKDARMRLAIAHSAGIALPDFLLNDG